MPRKTLVPFVLAVAILAVAAALPARGVSAHANQIRSAPGANQQIDASPGKIIVWYSEPIEASYSRIQVLDSGGRQVDLKDSALDPTVSTAMSVSVPDDLPNGTYTVAWRNLSSVDGHKVVGSFLFAIGEPVGAGAKVDTAQPLLQTPVDPWLRWIFLVGAMALFGVLLFELVVASPVFSDLEDGTNRLTAAVALGSVTSRLAVAALIATAIGHFGAVLQQAYITFDGAISFVNVKSVVLDSGWGRLWLWRSGALAVAALFVGIAVRSLYRGRRDEDDGNLLLAESIFGQVALVAAAAMLIIASLGSHNAAAPVDVRSMATVTDLLHIVASGAWVGGLLTLAFGIPVMKRAAGTEFRSILSEAIPRFSTLALLSSGTLVITGIFSGYMQVTELAATQTPYGWTLVAKVALVGTLLVFAAYNGLWIAKRLDCDEKAPGALRRVVLMEAGAAVLILLAVGWMTSLEPARQYASRHGIGIRDAVTHEATDSGTTISTDLEPGQVGSNTLRLRLSDSLGRPVTTATDVRVRIRSLDQDLGEPLFSLNNLGGGTWGVDNHRLNISGAYQYEVTVIRSDAFDARDSFRFNVTGGATATDAIRPTANVSWTLFGIQVMLLGALCLAIAAPSLGVSVAVPRGTFLTAGGIFMVFGVLIGLNVSTLRVGFPKELINPFPPTGDVIAQGEQWYAHACAYCHGDSGRGDGPGREELGVHPADLIVHVPLHSDSVLFQFIRDGIPGTGMPAQGGHLNDDQMWLIVTYLRILADEGSQ